MSTEAIRARYSSLSTARALGAGVVCLILLAATWVAATVVPVTHVQDAVALQDFAGLSRPWIDAPANALLGLLDPVLYTCWALGLVAVALRRRRARTALAVAVLAPVAPLSTEILKPLLAHPHAQVALAPITDASLPSGHAAAAMTLVLCAVLVSPRHLRPLVAALGSIFAIAVGFSLLVLVWHMPSDVFAGYLVAGCWSAVAVAALCFAERRSPSANFHAPERWSAPSALKLVEKLRVLAPLGLAGLGAIVLALWLRNGNPEAFAIDHRALVVAAGGIASLAVAICMTLTLALRR
jgi:membrane-associated phospholipid phosphatase